jgi:hypothetical protein
MSEKKGLGLNSQSLRRTLEKIVDPIKAHNALIMFLLLMGVLIYAVITVSSIIQISDDSEYRAQAETKSLTTSFDQATIKKVDDLRQSNDNATITLPGGRRNPFVD